MLAPPPPAAAALQPRLWGPLPPPPPPPVLPIATHLSLTGCGQPTGGASHARFGYSTLAQILPSPQDKGLLEEAASGGGGGGSSATPGGGESPLLAHCSPNTSTSLFPPPEETPIKLKKEIKPNTEWRGRPGKERCRLKTEPGTAQSPIIPCQVQEVTTSSKHEQNGGIPVGIAVARQRVQQSTPPPLLVACEERSTNHQLTGWAGPSPHWHYPGGMEPSLTPLQVPPLQLGRDPISGQLILLPSASIGESVSRTLVWGGGGSGVGSGGGPPPLVVPAATAPHQPQLLLSSTGPGGDRFIIAPPQSSTTLLHHHHHPHQQPQQHEKRRHDQPTSAPQLHGGGLTVGLFPPGPPQTPFLMMPFSQQNNSLLLSTHLTEHHNLNTMVVTNHQLSESAALLSPMEVISRGSGGVDGFCGSGGCGAAAGSGGALVEGLHPPSSLLISHTETNSYMRSDINTAAVYPGPPQPHHLSIPPHPHPPSVVVKEEAQVPEETVEEEVSEVESKAEVMDASNQTESAAEESEPDEALMKSGAVQEVAVKEEVVDADEVVAAEEVMEEEGKAKDGVVSPALLDSEPPALAPLGSTVPLVEPPPRIVSLEASSPPSSGLEASLVEPSTPAFPLVAPTPSELESTASNVEPLPPTFVQLGPTAPPPALAPLVQPPPPDLSGLDLLCCVASADKDTPEPLPIPFQSSVAEPQLPHPQIECPENEEEEESPGKGRSERWAEEEAASGLGLLWTAAERLLEAEGASQGRLTPASPSPCPSPRHPSPRHPDPHLSDDSQHTAPDSPARSGEWYTANDGESSKDLLKMKIKRRPGRPKKKLKLITHKKGSKTSEGRRGEPPVLEPWSAVPAQLTREGEDKTPSPLRSPPTLTPHKRKSSNDVSQTSSEDERWAGGPPLLSPVCLSPAGPLPSPVKRRKAGRPRKSGSPVPPQQSVAPPPSSPLTATPRLSASTVQHQPPASPSSPAAPHSQNKIKPKLKAEAKVKEWCDDEELDLGPDKENAGGESLLRRPPIWQSSPGSAVKNHSSHSPVKPKVKIVDPLKKEDEDQVKTSNDPPVKLSPVKTYPSSTKKPPPSLPDEVKNPSNKSSTKSPSRRNKSISPSGRCKGSSPGSPNKTPSTKSLTNGLKSPTSGRSVGSRFASVAGSPPLSRSPLPRASSTPLHSPLPQSTALSGQQLTPVTFRSIPDCKITEEHLKSLPFRILAICDGQFYPGEVTKVILPGIYEVHIFKERCRKPQILCMEQVLTTAVAEEHCGEELFVPGGSRVCAYWSQQYSCFYPGRVLSDSKAGPLLIDFDDGDNGTIERHSVRFLPHDYPIVEQPPNPLVGKRKRYNSSASSDGHKTSFDTANESEANNSSNCGDQKNSKESYEVGKSTLVEAKQDKSVSNGTKSETDGKTTDSEANSSSDETDASEAIRSVLEGFFRSEQEERERHKKRHKKHHKHRDGCRLHKCKHTCKHHRSHKHRNSRDERSRSSEFQKSKENIKESFRLNGKSSNDEEDPVDKECGGGDATTVMLTKAKPMSAAGGPGPERKEPWSWVGEGVRRGRALGPRGKGLKLFYKTIQRGAEVITIGDCAVFVSTGRPDRPFIGQIEQFWQCHMKKNMVVKIAWFYHPEETIGCPDKLPFPGGVFKSSHVDHNDVQTISHRCEVLPLSEFRTQAETDPAFLSSVYERNTTYFLAGFYDPSNITLTLDSEVSAALEDESNKKDVN